MNPAMADLCGWIDPAAPVSDEVDPVGLGSVFLRPYVGAPRAGDQASGRTLAIIDGFAPDGRVYICLRSPRGWDRGFGSLFQPLVGPPVPYLCVYLSTPSSDSLCLARQPAIGGRWSRPVISLWRSPCSPTRPRALASNCGVVRGAAGRRSRASRRWRALRSPLRPGRRRQILRPRHRRTGPLQPLQRPRLGAHAVAAHRRDHLRPSRRHGGSPAAGSGRGLCHRPGRSRTPPTTDGPHLVSCLGGAPRRRPQLAVTAGRGQARRRHRAGLRRTLRPAGVPGLDRPARCARRLELGAETDAGRIAATPAEDAQGRTYAVHQTNPDRSLKSTPDIANPDPNNWGVVGQILFDDPACSIAATCIVDGLDVVLAGTDPLMALNWTGRTGASTRPSPSAAPPMEASRSSRVRRSPSTPSPSTATASCGSRPDSPRNRLPARDPAVQGGVARGLVHLTTATTWSRPRTAAGTGWAPKPSRSDRGNASECSSSAHT